MTRKELNEKISAKRQEIKKIDRQLQKVVFATTPDFDLEDSLRAALIKADDEYGTLTRQRSAHIRSCWKCETPAFKDCGY